MAFPASESNLAPILPRRAPVTPRATMPFESASLPIEEWTRRIFKARPYGIISIIGPARSGKSTALSHLARVFSDDPDLILLDEPNGDAALQAARRGRVIFTARLPRFLPDEATQLNLARWTDEDLMAYLLAEHRDRCRSVMSRLLRDDQRDQLCGSPHLWRIVLDAMAVDPELPDTSAALCRAVDAMLHDDESITRAGRLAMRLLCDRAALPDSQRPRLVPPDVQHMLDHRVVQLLLGCEQIVWRLSMSLECNELSCAISPDIIDEIARRARSRPAVQQRLDFIANSDEHFSQQATAISILVSADPMWRPKVASPMLAGARVCGARWRNLDLDGSSMHKADFMRAVLCGATFRRALADEAVFCRADLRDAVLTRAIAVGADFTAADLRDVSAEHANFDDARLVDADLRGAMLRHARFVGANLRGANLSGADARFTRWQGAQIDDADLRDIDFGNARLAELDFRRAQLAGATFHRADLHSANLAAVQMHAPRFREAKLANADLTGTSFRDGDFRNADLRGAGLADIDWQGADLRNADFTNASFHLGSSRSGLVGSAIACEGSKTGFYTDEFNDQDFKPPEEIRRANLRGANLRHAVVIGTDWYLVDLRDARYTRAQAEYFAACGAILGSRVC